MRKNILFFVFILQSLFFNTYGQQHDHSKHKQDPDKGRIYWQMPNRVIEEIGIKEGMVVADVGSGNGYFTLKIAKVIGTEGRIYASDIDKTKLHELSEKVTESGFKNVEIIHGKKDDPYLPSGKIDLVLMVNVLHFIDDTKSFFSKITTCLKDEGVLAIVQWDAEKMDFELRDWDSENRELFTMRTTLRKIYDANYEVRQIKYFLPMQNIYVCQPREMKK